jgi:hypothetical protein
MFVLKPNKILYFFIVSLFFTTSVFSQSVSFGPRDNVQKSILAKTNAFAMEYCKGRVMDFSRFKIIDGSFRTVTLKQTIADSVDKLENISRELSATIRQQEQLISKIDHNIENYPLKGDVFRAEQVQLSKQNKQLADSVESILLIKQKLLAIRNQEEVDYYCIDYIGDSKNQYDESMFWYITLHFKPGEKIIVADFFPK